jgi:hypothetical protein
MTMAGTPAVGGSVVTAGTAGVGGASSGAGGIASGGIASGGQAGSSAGSGGAAMAGAAGMAMGGAAMGGSGGGGPLDPNAKTSLVWIWLDYQNALNGVTAHAKSFTHVSPAFYQVNYDYQSGIAKQVNENDNYDGLSTQQFTKKAHDAGLKVVPLIYGGAGNSGTDNGIHNMLDNADVGKAFIDSMIGEAMTKGYDGYNIDWEFGPTTYSAYGTKLENFFVQLKQALNQHGMILTVDLAGFYIKQCGASGGDGVIDVTRIADKMDLAIIEDYPGSLGNGAKMCAGNVNNPACDGNFIQQAEVMCGLPATVADIGLISPGQNTFAPDALNAVTQMGFHHVAIWPDDQVFLKADGMPNNGTWYSVLADFMAK